MSSCDEPGEEPIPAATSRFRALAFTGGLDVIGQLGVVHALLVSAGRAPDAVVGVSVGAVNAAVLAEVLQAGDAQAQVDKLRKFVDSYLRVPGEILNSILPDAFEINARQPLKPIELPIHFKEERADRRRASRSRWGLSFALNNVLKVRPTVRHFTRATNAALEMIAAADLPPYARYRKRAAQLAVLWYLSFRFVALAPLVWSLLLAAAVGANDRQRGSTAGKLLWHSYRAVRWTGSALWLVVLSAVWLLCGLAPILAMGWLAALAAAGIAAAASRALDRLAHVLVSPGRLPGAADALADFVQWLWQWLAEHCDRRPVYVYLGAWGLALLVVMLTFFVPLLQRLRRAALRRLRDRILEYLALNDGLGNTYALKQQLIDCFDPEYYGKIEMGEVRKRAAGGNPNAIESNPKRRKKTLGDYRVRAPAILVGAVAAEVRTGDLTVLADDVPVVDALLAATAYVPYFPAVEITPTGLEKRFFIDGGNISREAVGPLIELVRSEAALDSVAAVDVYPVHRLPAEPEAGRAAADASLIQIALRALKLQRLRDASIEQRLTKLYSHVLPRGAGRIHVAGRPFVKAGVYPLGIATSASIGREILGQTGLAFREVVYGEIAAGCRAALEGMLPGAIGRVAKSRGPHAVACRDVIRLRRAEPLPGSAESPGPGLVEICSRCALKRPGAFDLPQSLCVPAGKRPARPEWPRAAEPDRPVPPAPPPPPPHRRIEGWPLPRRERDGDDRPLVSLLFGGGVFRGVFHMGVLNALNELEIVPDLVAGSSVGSIIAAMIAQVFTVSKPMERRAQIARLAATFLAIDRLVLTDRMADLVRGFTVRAGESNFSLRDLDLVLRRYDIDRGASFSRRLREVAAGCERLLHLSPVDFTRLVEAGRTRRTGDVARQLEEGVQRFLERNNIRQEILGAEPLAMLIRSHVIEQLAMQGSAQGLFSSFLDKGVVFLATTTNLTLGELEILDPATGGDRGEVSLLEGLLASSAFPAVFRPREAWEVFRSASRQDRYFDGGIIDNLPLDAVAEFLQANRGIARRPRLCGSPVPHLLFTASLEVDMQALPDDRVEIVSRSFLRLRRRAQTFTYNRKIDAYAKVQRDLRDIYEDRTEKGDRPAWTPLDLHLVAVKPQWLCGTFGFHPMLGFRRRKQAQSIAHGCASTLAQLHAERIRNPAWTAGWGVRGLDRMDPHSVLGGAERLTLVPQRKGKAAGECWFRTGISCPFSAASLAQLSIEAETARQLARIYEACGRAETHLPTHGAGPT